MIKVVVPRMALRILDRAIQAHGAAGVCDDFPMASARAHARTIRLADGPDEVSREAIAKLELSKGRKGRNARLPAEARRESLMQASVCGLAHRSSPRTMSCAASEGGCMLRRTGIIPSVHRRPTSEM